MFAPRASTTTPGLGGARMTLQRSTSSNENQALSKTPSTKKGLSSSSSTTKRRALGDISNKKANGSGNGNGFGKGGAPASVKKSLFVFEDRGTSGNANKSTRKPIKTKSTSVTWQDQQQAPARSALRPKPSMKPKQPHVPSFSRHSKMQPMRSKSAIKPAATSFSSMAPKFGPVEDIELPAGRSWAEQQALEHKMMLEEERLEIDDDDDQFWRSSRNWRHDLELREEEAWRAKEEALNREAIAAMDQRALTVFDDVDDELEPPARKNSLLFDNDLSLDFDDDVPLHEQIDMSFLDL